MDYVLAISMLFLMCLYIKWKLARRHFNKLVEKIPHYVKPLPIIGHGHLFLIDSERLLAQIYRLFSMPTPSKVWLLHQTFILIKTPEDIQTILNSPKALEKHQLYKFMKPAFGEGLLSAPAQKWKKNRKIISPTFKQNILDQFVNVFYKQALVLTDILKENCGNVIDSRNFAYDFSWKALCETVFGVEINLHHDENSFYRKAMSRGMEIAWERTINVFYQFDFIFNLTSMAKEEKELVGILHSIADKIIEEKQQIYKQGQIENTEKTKDATTKKVFLELLMELEETGVKLTKTELRDELNTIIITGTDTISTIGSFVFQMVALHEKIQAKVYQEIINISGGDKPINYYDLPNLTYLEKVIKETLRLFPIGPVIVRTATDDIKLGEHIIPKGAGLVLGIGPMMRSEEYYENPLEFKPERFDPKEISKAHPYAFLPFSGGPRNCIGSKYAMMVLKILVATVVRKYYLETTYRNVEDIKTKANITIKSVNGFPLKLTERK